MPSFSTAKNALRAPFGKNVYLRSTMDIGTVSYTFSMAGIPAVPDTANTQAAGTTGQKVLQPGTLLARISVGAEAGKVGVYGTGAFYTALGTDLAINIVGFCDTFLPWQLLERDVEVACVYAASVVQAWCMEYVQPAVDSSGSVPLTDVTRNLLNGRDSAGVLLTTAVSPRNVDFKFF